MAFKFFNIKKANDEIDRLTALTAPTEQLTARVAELESENKLTNEANATLSAKVAELETASVQHVSELATAKQTISTITATHATELSAAKEVTDGAVKTAGAKEAARINLNLGVPAVKVPAGENPLAGPKGNLLEQYTAMSRGAEKTAFLKKHKAELLKLERNGK